MNAQKIYQTAKIFSFLLVLGLLVGSGPAGARHGGWDYGPAFDQQALDLIDENSPPAPALYRGPWDLSAKPSPLYALGVREYKANNFRRAEQALAKFIKDSPHHPDVPRAVFLRSKSLFHLGSYDEARSVLDDFLASKPGLLWEARCHQEISALYQQLPNSGFRRGDKIFFNREHREGNRVYLWIFNQRQAVRELEIARPAYLLLAAAKPEETSAAASEDLVAEAAQNDLKVVEALKQSGGRLWDASEEGQKIEPPADGASFDFAWPERTQSLFVLEEAERLAGAKVRPQLASEARYQKAVFLMAFPEAPPLSWVKQSAQKHEECQKARKNGDPVCLDSPFIPAPRFDPLTILQSIAQDFAGGPDSDRTLGTVARVLEGRGRFVEAEKAYDELVQKYPKSKYLDDAKESLYNLRHASISLTGLTALAPQAKKELTVSARNVKSVTLEAYQVDLRSAMTSPAALASVNRWFSAFDSTFGGTKSARKAFGRKVATWHYEPNDAADHRMTSGTTSLPLTDLGAYLILAKGGDEEQVSLAVLTDLVLVSKQDRGQVHYWVTDATTGQPVPGVALVVKEQYWDGSAPVVRSARYTTDAEGRANHALVKIRYSTSDVEAIAAVGDRFAFDNAEWAGSGARGSPQDQSRLFTITDRPVYRPGDEVHWKVIARGYHHGKNENLPGAKLRLTLTNPRGEVVVNRTIDADSYGTVQDSVKLGREATLGVYHLTAEVLKGFGSYSSSGSQFRVEEYKKPEFKVTVSAAAPDVRLGESVKAEIAADYYFGAPVSAAKVKYQVYRQPFYHAYYPPSRYDWLYGAGYGLAYEKPFEWGTGNELVSEGSGQTDEHGKLEVALPAAEKDAKFDYLYTLQAQVTDLSRRTINGMGEVKVTRDPFHIFATTRDGFYSPKDNVEIEVDALTPQDKPVRGQGSVTVYRLSYPPGEKEQAAKIESRPLATDDSGRTFVKWTAPEVGQFRFTFQLRQGNGPEVESNHFVYVAGESFDPGRFKFQKVTLRAEKRSTLRGETIRLLLGTPRPDAALWFSQEGGDEILAQRVLHVQGTGTVIEIPADEARSPNFFVRAVLVDGGEVHFAEQELFIPPGEEILDVGLAPDSAEHRPGEKGLFTVTVKDHQGKPVKGQLCLSVFDASVLYIQGDTTGDIRRYYYGDRRYLSLWVQSSLQIFPMLAHWAPEPPHFKPGGLPYAGGSYSWYGGYGGYGGLGLIGSGRGGGGKSSGWWAQDSSGIDTIAVSGALTGGNMDTRGGADRGLYAYKDGAAAEMIPLARHAGPSKWQQQASEPALREFFPDTALWVPAVETDERGQATVPISFPDSVTTWNARLVVVDAGRMVGTAKASVVTAKHLVARIETPRFLVEGDRLSLAAVLHNGFDHPITMGLRLYTKGLELLSTSEIDLSIPANADARHDFAAFARTVGQAEVKLVATSSEEGDALQRTFPVLEWGSQKLLSAQDTLKHPGALNLKLELPAQRRSGSASLTIEAAPSLGGVLLRALPYLIDYPYGCLEQTISRFVPAAVVARTLKDAGISLEQLKPVGGRPTLDKPLGKLAWYDAVRSSAELDSIIREGIERISSMQNPDGGFPWFAGGDSDVYMTAYALFALHEAQLAGREIGPALLERAVNFLHERIDELGANHLGVFVSYVVGELGRPMPELLQKAYAVRANLSAYGQSLLALGLQRAGLKPQARQVVENLSDLAWVDEANQTATFKPPPDRWWLWWFDRVEATAWALRAFLEISPAHPQVERFAKWLLLNREGNRWTNTKDTSMAVLALVRYMKTRGELSPDATITVAVNDRKVKSFRVTAANVLGLDGTVVLPDEALSGGPVNVTVQLDGRGAVYASAFLTFFTKEDRIAGSGYEIGVKRSYSKLLPVERTQQDYQGKIKVREYQAVPLKEGDALQSGDLIEVHLAIDSKNDYSYLVFEDYKPAGCEPLELKSGNEYAHGAWLYRELRDERVVNFLSDLPQGTQVINYRLRAEIPGTFRVLPHRAHAMYATRVQAISDSAELTIRD